MSFGSGVSRVKGLGLSASGRGRVSPNDPGLGLEGFRVVPGDESHLISPLPCFPKYEPSMLLPDTLIYHGYRKPWPPKP